MTPQEVRDEIDLRVTAAWAAIQGAQAAYFAGHGHYWQGLPSHSSIPANGAEVAPDLAGESPSDQNETWSDMGLLPALTLSRLRMDVYAGPAGPGYALISEVELGGAIWERVWHSGPETWRSFGWRIQPVITD